MTSPWEYVNDESGDHVRRIAVPGGWLYQVEMHMTSDPVTCEPGVNHSGWSQPVFVPTGGAS